MTLRYSTGLRNHLAGRGSFKNAFQGGRIEIYTGAQPASADAAATGTLLVLITDNNGAHTAEVKATGTLTLTTGAAGSVNGVTVNGVAIIDAAVPFNTSLSQTAADLADAINASQSVPEYRASAVGAVVTITAPQGMGAGANGHVVTATLTTMTATYADMASGVTALNGLKFGSDASGAVSKRVGQVWEGTNVASGTAGWYRMYASAADTGGVDAAGVVVREDGAIGTSGQQLNFSASTALAAAAKTTLDTWTRTVPAS